MGRLKGQGHQPLLGGSVIHHMGRDSFSLLFVVVFGCFGGDIGLSL